MPLTWNAIFMANVPDLDTDESTLATEFIFGSGATAGSAADPLANDIVSFTVNDADSDNIWDNNNTGSGNETATLTEPGGSRTVNLDSTQVYNATLTYDDGSTAPITAVIIQLTDGGVYLAPEYQPNADDTALNAAPLRSITLNSLVTNASELVADRQSGDFVPCFVDGTPILTPSGPRPVGSLHPGEMVDTLDHGPQPLRWVGSREARARGAAAPIEIAPAPGAGRFAGPLRVSPHHRMLVAGWRAELCFGAEEVLVPAKALVDGDTVRRAPGGRVRYWHLLFDRHEIVWAAGHRAESLYLGDMTRAALDPAARAEIGALRADARVIRATRMRPARPFVTCREGRMLTRAA